MKKLFLAALTVLLFAACEEKNPNEPGRLVPKTADEDSSVPSIRINNVLLHAETIGDSNDPMIVVLHGGPGSDYRYLLNCKDLAAAGYYVVLYDQSGCGLSQRREKGEYSIQMAYDELTGVIEHYRTSPNQKIFLLGHSWGAMLATGYINEYPARIAGAILCEPGGFVWQDIVDYVGRTRDYSLFSETLSDVTYLDQFFSGKGSAQEVLDYKFGLSQSTDGANDSPLGDEMPPPFWRLGLINNRAFFDIGEATHPDWTTNLHAYDTPVMFVYSEHNRAYGLEHAKHVSSAYPNIQLVRIDDAGHDMLTFPAGWNNFYPLALNYLNELD
jgi:proline iminopeptidase